MQNWDEHKDNHDRFLKSCLDASGSRQARTGSEPRPIEADVPAVAGTEYYLPIQNVEKMRWRISSAVVAPVIASMGPSAL